MTVAGLDPAGLFLCLLFIPWHVPRLPYVLPSFAKSPALANNTHCPQSSGLYPRPPL